MPKTIQINLHNAQRHIWTNRKKRNVVCCGRRFGKTVMSWALGAECSTSGLNWAYIAPTYTDLEQRYQEAIEFYQPVIKNTKFGEITFWNGTRAIMAGMHRFDGLRGSKFGRVIIDEAAHSRNLEDAWQKVIRPTLTDYRGDAYFISTPNGSNFFKTLYDRSGSESWQSFQMPTLSNPFINAEEIAEARQELPELIFRQEYLAEFIDASGARVKRSDIHYGEPPSGLTIGIGVDLAISDKTTADYTAIVVVGKAVDGTVWVLDVWRDRVQFNDILRAIRHESEQWKPQLVYVEEVQFQAAIVQELLRTTSLPVRGYRPERSKLLRFAPLEARFERNMVRISNNVTKEFEKELLSFTGTKTDTHDDMIDALSMAFQATQSGSTAVHKL